MRTAIKLQTRFETLELDLNAKQIARRAAFDGGRDELHTTMWYELSFLGSHLKSDEE